MVTGEGMAPPAGSKQRAAGRKSRFLADAEKRRRGVGVLEPPQSPFAKGGGPRWPVVCPPPPHPLPPGEGRLLAAARKFAGGGKADAASVSKIPLDPPLSKGEVGWFMVMRAGVKPAPTAVVIAALPPSPLLRIPASPCLRVTVSASSRVPASSSPSTTARRRHRSQPGSPATG
jgi:hypothetical protein